MAEYYAVLKKAVGGLAVDSSDARRAVYEKARNALIGQLKAINPPLTTSEISRQRLELEEAIRRVEREAGADYSAAAPPTAEIYDDAPEEPAEIDFDLELDEVAEPAPRGRRNREHQEAFHQAVQVAERQAPAPRGERREAPPAAPIKGRAARNEPSFDVRAEPKGGGRGGRGSDYAPDVRANSGGADVVPPQDRMRPSDGRRSKRRGRDEQEEYGEAARSRGSRLPSIILTVVILGVLAGLGALGWANREFVGEVVASLQGGSEPSSTPASVESESEPVAPSDSTVRDVGGDAGISAPNQEIARVEPGAVPALPGAQQKAILYEESRAQQGEVVASLNGGVTWRYIPSSPNGPVIEASLAIPERGLSLVMTIRKNLDTEMPASHLVEITAEGTQLPGGGIDAIPRVVMKPAEEQKGTPLAGTPTKVVDGLYWIALAGNAQDAASNVSIMRSSSWFDLPLLYKSGQRAILTFEKGAAGREAFDKALAAWGN